MIVGSSNHGRKVIQASIFQDPVAQRQISRRVEGVVRRAARRAAWAHFVSTNHTEDLLLARLGLPLGTPNYFPEFNSTLLIRILLQNPENGWTVLRGYVRACARECAFSLTNPN